MTTITTTPTTPEIPKSLSNVGEGDSNPSLLEKRTVSASTTILTPPVSSSSSRTKSEGVVFRPDEDALLAPGTQVSNVQNKTDGIKKENFWTKRRVKIAATVGVVLLVSIVAIGLLFIPGGPLVAVGAALTGAIGSSGSAGVCLAGGAVLLTAAGGLSYYFVPILIPINSQTVPRLSDNMNEDEALDSLHIDTSRDFVLTINGEKLGEKLGEKPREKPTKDQLKAAFTKAFTDPDQRLIAIKLAGQWSREPAINHWQIFYDKNTDYQAALNENLVGITTEVTITSDANGDPIITGKGDAYLYDLHRSGSGSRKERHIIKQPQPLKYEMNWGTQILTIK